MKKIYLLPNLVTTLNLFCGFFSAIQSFQGEFKMAAWSICAGMIFDMLDGRIARMARATSSFGVEYDSLSDLLTFGMAPGVLMYLYVLQPFGRYGWFLGFFYLVCAALRLARFNVTTSHLPKAYFEGLPTPGAAGVIASFVIFQETFLSLELEWLRPICIGITFLMSAFMISSIPFPSFKEINWRSRVTRSFAMFAVLALVLILVNPEFMLFVTFGGYVLGSVFWFGYCIYRGKSPLKYKVEALVDYGTKS
jgi:CDP-diacylglycerol---serine O-phosphatidyltransferase